MELHVVGVIEQALSPLGFCLRVIVNDTHRNLEKTT